VKFDDLCKLDPRLRQLDADARVEARKRKYRCAARPWYRLVKPQLVWLVGWSRPDKHPVLGSREAYDVAYRHLYEMMPDCRMCSCF
jgi:hypothetical protein